MPGVSRLVAPRQVGRIGGGERNALDIGDGAASLADDGLKHGVAVDGADGERKIGQCQKQEFEIDGRVLEGDEVQFYGVDRLIKRVPQRGETGRCVDVVHQRLRVGEGELGGFAGKREVDRAGVGGGGDLVERGVVRRDENGPGGLAALAGYDDGVGGVEVDLHRAGVVCVFEDPIALAARGPGIQSGYVAAGRRERSWIGRVDAEECGFLAEDVDGCSRVLDNRPFQGRVPGDERVAGGGVGGRGGYEVKVAGGIGGRGDSGGGGVVQRLVDEEEAVAGVDIVAGACDPKGGARGIQRPRDGGLGRDGVLRDDGRNIRGSFEDLRRLAGAGHALYPGSGGNEDVVRRAGGAGEGEGEIGRSGDARRGLVADQLREVEDGRRIDGGPQVGFVGDALLIEAENVERDRPGVEQSNAEVGVVARRERCERGQRGAGERREQAGLERGLGADTIADGAEAWAVVNDLGRLGHHAGAAAAKSFRG